MNNQESNLENSVDFESNDQEFDNQDVDNQDVDNQEFENLQQLSSRRPSIQIDVDPTIMHVKSTPQNNHDSDHHDSDHHDSDHHDSDHHDPEIELTNRSNMSNRSEDITLNFNQHDHEKITIPSVYVHDRLHELNNVVRENRRNRFSKTIKKYIFLLLQFYVLFFIGVYISYYLMIWLSESTGPIYIPFIKTICGCNNTNNISQYSGSHSDGSGSHSDGSGSHSDGSGSTQIQIKYIPISGRIIDEIVSNMTNIIDIKFNTTGFEFLNTSSKIITNMVINTLETLQIDKLNIRTAIIDNIIANNISVQNITSELINTLDVYGINLFSTSLYGTTLNKCTVGQCL